MKNILYGLALLAFPLFSQTTPAPASLLDPRSYGVVLEYPGMKNVLQKTDVPYWQNGSRALHLDLYWPPGLAASEKRPAIVFLNAIGDDSEQKVKSWGIYSSWPRLVASQGYIGISMESDREHIQESLEGVFRFLAENGSRFNIDSDRIGVYAASANVRESVNYLMGKNAHPGIRAAVLYYGFLPQGPFRKDLPVYYVVAEGDVQRSNYAPLLGEVLKNNAPWTIKMASGLPHGFDAFSDTDEARRVVKETLSFWQNNLDPVPQPSWPYSKGRDVLGTVQMDNARATGLLESILAEHPRDVSVLTFYGGQLRHGGKNAEAEAIYKKALDLDPKNHDAGLSIVQVLFAQGKTESGQQYLDAAVGAGWVNREHYANWGYAMLIAGQDKQGAKFYEKALALEPRGIDFYNLGCAYAKLGEKEKSLTALEKAVQHGYTLRQSYLQDTDLEPVRAEGRFKILLEKLN